MIPDNHVKAHLQVAYVQAVAAQAGFACEFVKNDYGQDACISEIAFFPDGTYSPTGYQFWVQMKASQRFHIQERGTAYDLDADAHARLVRHIGSAIILLVFCVPADDDVRLTVTEEYLQMQRCCYWYPRPDTMPENKRSTRIVLPRTNLFTPQACRELMEAVKRDGRL